MVTRILVVDDNRDTLRTYIRALSRKIKPKQWGHSLPALANDSLVEVEEADTISYALNVLRNQPIELLVVDLKIPGSKGDEMGGLELISESMNLDPLRPIIAITGYGSIALARKTLTQGVFDFIEKSDTAIEELINSVQRAIDTRNEKILRSGNPFTPMTGVEPPVFGGRTGELEFFEERLHRAIHSRYCEHFLVLGDWGIGKSTLVKEYKKICQSRGHIASVVPLESLQPGTSLTEAARSIVEGILRDLPYPVERLKKVTNYFASFGINVFGTGLQFSKDTARKDLPQAFLHDTLSSLWEDIADKTEVLVLLLDDLDNFLTVSEIVMTLKQTLSMESLRKTKILLGMTSTPLGWNGLTSTKKHHPLSRYFLARVELAPLNNNDLRDTIFKSLAGTGVVFSEDVIGRVFEYTQGHPFEMQVLCNHLFNSQLSRRVGIDVWDKALQTALYDMGIATFEFWFSMASKEETKVLHIIAQSNSPISVKAIHDVAMHNKTNISATSIAKFLQRLIEKKLIEKSGRGLYGIPDRMFRAYVCTRAE